MWQRRLEAAALVAALSAAGPVTADTLLVPGQYPTSPRGPPAPFPLIPPRPILPLDSATTPAPNLASA